MFLERFFAKFKSKEEITKVYEDHYDSLVAFGRDFDAEQVEYYKNDSLDQYDWDGFTGPKTQSRPENLPDF